MEPAVISSVVFDLGRVLVDFSHQIFVDYLLAEGVAPVSEPEFCRITRVADFESGNISSDEFVRLVTTLLPAKKFGSEEARLELIGKWQRIFSPIDQMLEFAARLRPRYRTFIISNTNALHWEYLLSEYRLDQLVDGLLPSFEAGVLKPDQRIFAAAEEKFGLTPAGSVFIDDIETNLAGATERGWQTIHHRSTGQTIAKLKSLGVEV